MASASGDSKPERVDVCLEETAAAATLRVFLAAGKEPSSDLIDLCRNVLVLECGMEKSQKNRGANVADIFITPSASRVLWQFLGPLEGLNGHRCCESHPICATGQNFKRMSIERCSLFSQNELARDVQLRWERAEQRVVNAGLLFNRSRAGPDSDVSLSLVLPDSSSHCPPSASEQTARRPGAHPPHPRRCLDAGSCLVLSCLLS